jgi:hypothetical protein
MAVRRTELSAKQIVEKTFNKKSDAAAWAVKEKKKFKELDMAVRHDIAFDNTTSKWKVVLFHYLGK